jgi:hypothetical protein
LGGDYYDYLSFSDERVGLVVADVSGKGISAALLMASLQASVRNVIGPDTSPCDANHRLNEILYRSTTASRYATMFLGLFDSRTRTLRYSNAGHNPPMLLRRDGNTKLSAGGLPLGILDKVVYAEGSQSLEPGDLLLLYTDGAIEAANAVSEEFRAGPARGVPARAAGARSTCPGSSTRPSRGAPALDARLSPAGRHHARRGAGRGRCPLRITLPLRVLLWCLANSAAGAAIGFAIAAFQEGSLDRQVIWISILFGNVVGFTAIISAVYLFPRFVDLPSPLQLILQIGTLLGGSVLGTAVVIQIYPLFLLHEYRTALRVFVVNGVVATIVGTLLFSYEAMRARLRESLRVLEEVRLKESELRAQAARAQLAALQARIKPHFFFNTLNTISSLVAEDPTARRRRSRSSPTCSATRCGRRARAWFRSATRSPSSRST